MKFGIVGLGNHAINRVMPAIAEAGHQVSAIYSRNIEKARKEGNRYSSNPYDNLEKFLSQGDIEAVYIASPNFLHYEQAKSSLLSGKHVLLEKQMTLKNEHAEELVKISKEEELVLAIGFHLRFHPAVADVKQIIHKGDIGNVIHVSGMFAGLSSRAVSTPDSKWWREEEKVGGGAIMGAGVHVIDTLNFIMERAPVRVSAFRKPSGQSIETTEVVSMDYGDTTAEALTSRSIAHPMNNLTVFGTNGTLVVQGMFSTKVDSAMIREGRKLRDYKGVSMYREEIRSFAKATQGEESIIARGSDGLAVVRIVNAAYSSDSEGTIERL